MESPSDSSSCLLQLCAILRYHEVLHTTLPCSDVCCFTLYPTLLYSASAKVYGYVNIYRYDIEKHEARLTAAIPVASSCHLHVACGPQSIEPNLSISQMASRTESWRRAKAVPPASNGHAARQADRRWLLPLAEAFRGRSLTSCSTR